MASSKGCYLELVNRAFEEIKVEFIPKNSSDWLDSKSPDLGTKTLKDDENNYYFSEILEMNGAISAQGMFSIKISIGKNCVTVDDFNLEDGRRNEEKIRYIDLSETGGKLDCYIVITYGLNVQLIAEKEKESGFANNKGCYRFEFFRMSKRRFGIMNDYHYGCKGNNDNDQKTVFQTINKFIKRPEFIVMPGDLLDNPIYQKGKDRDIWKHFIDPLEKRYIPIADGFGNHDLWSSVGSTDVKNRCLKRNSKRKQKLCGYSDEWNKNKNGKYENDNKGYHYRWQMELKKNGKKVLIVFFMLNNVPAEKNRKDKVSTEKTQQKGTYSYDSLRYLKDAMQDAYNKNNKNYDGVYGLLFFHTNYECQNNSDTRFTKNEVTVYEPERWWTYKDKQVLAGVLDNPVFPVLMSFFGHSHISNIMKQYLYTSQTNRTEHFGYLCASSKEMRRLNLIDISLTEENGEYYIEIEGKYANVKELSMEDHSLKKVDGIKFPLKKA